MEKKRTSFIVFATAFITVIVLFAAFVAVLFILNKNGYVSFVGNTKYIEKNTVRNNNDQKSDSNSSNFTIDAESNMTNDEVFDFWNKIKGNWAHIQFNNDLCAGSSLEINTYVKLSKFNSDGIITYRIVSFNKNSDGTYELNLILPVDLNNQMIGNIVASYVTFIIDLGEPNDNKMRVKRGNNWIEFEYVGENKTIFGEETKFQNIDGGFSQDYYCNWYKENH